MLRAPNQMQKISSYLYPNRINVVADLALFSTRWNIVYQNRVKIYQGVDNALTIDVKNTDQKRIDISEMTLEMIVMTTAGKLITTVEVVPMQTTGLALATIPQSDLENIEPQFLSFSIYRINDDLTKTLLYADTQFGAKGNMELIGTIMSVETPVREITRFIEVTDPAILPPPWIQVTYSDAVEIVQPNLVDIAANDSISFDFFFDNLDADVTIQFTKDPVISSGDIWVDIETFTVTNSTATLTKTYTNPTYARDYKWARIKHIRVRNTTGNIDKVLVRL